MHMSPALFVGNFYVFLVAELTAKRGWTGKVAAIES
jgi:hypothetical protein